MTTVDEVYRILLNDEGPRVDPPMTQEECRELAPMLLVEYRHGKGRAVSAAMHRWLLQHRSQQLGVVQDDLLVCNC